MSYVESEEKSLEQTQQDAALVRKVLNQANTMIGWQIDPADNTPKLPSSKRFGKDKTKHAVIPVDADGVALLTTSPEACKEVGRLIAKACEIIDAQYGTDSFVFSQHGKYFSPLWKTEQPGLSQKQDHDVSPCGIIISHHKVEYVDSIQEGLPAQNSNVISDNKTLCDLHDDQGSQRVKHGPTIPYIRGEVDMAGFVEKLSSFINDPANSLELASWVTSNTTRSANDQRAALDTAFNGLVASDHELRVTTQKRAFNAR